jgi:hypothetical protein
MRLGASGRSPTCDAMWLARSWLAYSVWFRVWLIGAGTLGFLEKVAEREEYARILSDPPVRGDKVIYRS